MADVLSPTLGYTDTRREHLAHLLPSSVQGTARSHRPLD
jgi:hypothetical protein